MIDPGDPRFNYRPGLHAFAVVCVIATFLLITLGGSVTSHKAGLAVPDWPTTFSYNMYTVPLDMWVGQTGPMLEHTHRLKGSLVGLLTIVLTVWVWITQKPRPNFRGWLRWMGVLALALVIVQGLMGGFRVTEFFAGRPVMATSLAIIHGIIGQVFLCLLVLIAAATSRWWITHTYPTGDDVPTPGQVQGLRLTSILLLSVLLVQLALGAMIRHTQSTLAIPDFPASYGKLLPPLSEPGIAAAMQRVMGEIPPGFIYPSPSQVLVHFTHRLWAVVVLLSVGVMLLQIAKARVKESAVLRPAAGLGVLLLVQITLGAAVIWAADLAGHPEIATSHQALGAILLGCAALLAFRIHRAYPWVDPTMLETPHLPTRPFAAMEQPSA